MNTVKFERALGLHKRLLAYFGRTQDKSLLGRISFLGEELILVCANFQCEHCKAQKKLTIHHVIERKNKSFMDPIRFSSQRRYWANLCVLCIPCHAGVHLMDKEHEESMKPISEVRINKIKKEYEVD